MKKITRAISVILALATLALALPAMAATGDITIFRQGDGGSNDSLRAMAYYNSTLYLFTYGKTYRTWTREAGVKEYPLDQSILEREDGYANFRTVLAGPDGLYALVHSYESSENSTSFDEAMLYKVEFAEDGTASFVEHVELDWDDLIESYDDYEYARETNYAFITGDKLAFTTYMDNGVSIVSHDINTGDCEIYDLDIDLQNAGIEEMCAYKEGYALFSVYSYRSDNDPISFYILDLSSGDAEEAFLLPVTNYQIPRNLLYDEATDALYYTLSGQLFKMQGLDASTAVSVAAIQTNGWGDQRPALTEDGYFICADYETVIARNTDPSARPAKSITVYTGYNSAMESAYHTFANQHQDVEVVITQSYEDVTEAMMNQSSAVDIYTLYVNSEDYAALLARGYLAELSSSEKITALVSEMYEGIQSIAVKDGETLALPIEMYANTMSYNPAALKKLGLTEEDVPTTWIELLQMIQSLPERAEEAGVMVFEPYMTQRDAKFSLFYKLLNDYMNHIKKAGEEAMSFDTELMHKLLAEFEKIDFTAFGLMEDYDDEGYARSVSYDDASTLFLYYSDISCNSYYFRGERAKPMPLALDEGMEPQIEANVNVAIVNPYSKNRELAIEYLEHAIDALPEYFLVNTCPDRNDPIRNIYYEETLTYYEEQLESIRKEIEKAEGDEKEQWQTQLDEMQGYYEEYKETGSWDASPESIAFYRQYAQYLQVTEFFGLDNDNYGEFYDQIQQYLDGAIDGETMLKNIDKKLKMMLMEGM